MDGGMDSFTTLILILGRVDMLACVHHIRHGMGMGFFF